MDVRDDSEAAQIVRANLPIPESEVPLVVCKVVYPLVPGIRPQEALVGGVAC